MRRKRICFGCHEPWTPGYRGKSGGKDHWIEVFEEASDNKFKETQFQDAQQEKTDGDSDTDKHQDDLTQTKGAIATLSTTLYFSVFKVKGVVQGQRVVVLIDSGATLNFIDASYVKKRGLKVEEHEGLSC